MTDLTIDLDALRDNYRIAQRLASGAEVACVVKADAYGLGIKRIAPAFAAVGAKSFFVATAEEGAELRDILRPTAGEADIYILNGFFSSQGELYLLNHLRPCLASLEEIKEWRTIKRTSRRTGRRTSKSAKLPSALHIDSGINRLGISARDGGSISAQDIHDIDLALVMSHLACADNPENKMNQDQRKRFHDLRAQWHIDPKIPASLANTAGLFLGAEFALQMVRVGIGLYGGDPFEQPYADLPFRPVVHLTSFIAQTREIAIGEHVGYGASFCATQPTRIAVIPAGYADGYARAARNINVFISDQPAPVIGRISMDMLVADITDLPANLAKRGQKVELLGDNITIGEFARAANTIPHNIATGLGRRLSRHYIESQ